MWFESALILIDINNNYTLCSSKYSLSFRIIFCGFEKTIFYEYMCRICYDINYSQELLNFVLPRFYCLCWACWSFCCCLFSKLNGSWEEQKKNSFLGLFFLTIYFALYIIKKEFYFKSSKKELKIYLKRLFSLLNKIKVFKFYSSQKFLKKINKLKHYIHCYINTNTCWSKVRDRLENIFLYSHCVHK